jgi:hypothetical protein
MSDIWSLLLNDEEEIPPPPPPAALEAAKSAPPEASQPATASSSKTEKEKRGAKRVMPAVDVANNRVTPAKKQPDTRWPQQHRCPQPAIYRHETHIYVPKDCHTVYVHDKI